MFITLKTYKINHKAKNLIKYSIYSISEFKKKKLINIELFLILDAIQHQFNYH